MRARPVAAVWIVLTLLTALGAYLRLSDLGRLGFRWDEDLSSLAVRAILAKGVPELASGMIYLRGGPLLYAMAASAKVFGFNEFALRLPSALAGIALIPLGFAFARALFGKRVGLVVAALLSISVWDIEFSRYARMYAPFTFFYILTLLCIWKYQIRSREPAGGALCILLALIAVSLHQLGYTLAAAMFFPLVLGGPAEWRRPRRFVFPVVAAGAIAAFFFSWSRLLDEWRELPIAATAAAGQTAPGGAPLPLPQLPVLTGLLGRAPAVAIVLAAAIVAATAVFALRRQPSALRGLLLAAVACGCALSLFNFALLAVLALAWAQRTGLSAWRSVEVRFAASLTAAAFVAWLALTVALGLGPFAADGGGSIKSAVRALLDYPHFFVFWGYAREWPFASVVAAVGGLWVFDRIARRAPDRAAGFLLLCLGTPLIVNGLFDTQFELFRYNVPLDTFYFCLVALGLLRWRSVLSAWRAVTPGPDERSPASQIDGRSGAVVTALLTCLVLAFDLNPLRGALVSRQDYRNDGVLYRAFGMTRYPDFKTPSAYVQEHASPSDTVIVLDSREIYNYLGRVDYWVRSAVYESQTYERDGELRDLYVSTPLIMSAAELERMLSSPGGTKWLIASDSMLAQTTAVDDEIKRYIRSQGEHVVYVGRDGQTKVYRF